MQRQASSIRAARQSARIRDNRTGRARHPAAMPSFRHDRTAATASRSRTTPTAPDPTTLAAATWLACGVVLLGLTPLPLRSATLGWSLAFWLLAAPSILLLARSMCVRSKQVL